MHIKKLFVAFLLLLFLSVLSVSCRKENVNGLYCNGKLVSTIETVYAYGSVCMMFSGPYEMFPDASQSILQLCQFHNVEGDEIIEIMLTNGETRVKCVNRKIIKNDFVLSGKIRSFSLDASQADIDISLQKSNKDKLEISFKGPLSYPLYDSNN